jgi:hypothetical protein
MKIRETAISKLHQLPEPLLQEVNDFIDFIAQKHQSQLIKSHSQETLEEKWLQWFQAVDALEVSPPQSVSTYPELLLSKYRQQGLDL